MRHIQLLMYLFSLTLVLFPVDCNARPSHKSTPSEGTSVLVGSHHTPKRVPPNTLALRPRARHSYQSFLSIGSGWNLYYSSWAGALLPIQFVLSDPSVSGLDVFGLRDFHAPDPRLMIPIPSVKALLTGDFDQARRLRPRSSL